MAMWKFQRVLNAGSRSSPPLLKATKAAGRPVVRWALMEAGLPTSLPATKQWKTPCFVTNCRQIMVDMSHTWTWTDSPVAKFWTAPCILFCLEMPKMCLEFRVSTCTSSLRACGTPIYLYPSEVYQVSSYKPAMTQLFGCWLLCSYFSQWHNEWQMASWSRQTSAWILDGDCRWLFG